jgi:hypothetical protein
MKLLRRFQPSPALVVACLALALSLGGVSYAAFRLPANSVGTRQVINHSLLKGDFKPGQLPRGPRGFTGVAGANGANGATGPMGPAGIALIGAVGGPAGAMCAYGGGACQVGSSTATCPAGTVVLGGGYTSDSTNLSVPFTARTSGTTFDVIGINYDASARSITAQAICATGPGVSSAGAAQAQQSFGNAIASFKAQLGN